MWIKIFYIQSTVVINWGLSENEIIELPVRTQVEILGVKVDNLCFVKLCTACNWHRYEHKDDTRSKS